MNHMHIGTGFPLKIGAPLAGILAGTAVSLPLTKSLGICQVVGDYFQKMTMQQLDSIHGDGVSFVARISSVCACGFLAIALGAISGGIVTYLGVNYLSKRILKDHTKNVV